MKFQKSELHFLAVTEAGQPRIGGAAETPGVFRAVC